MKTYAPQEELLLRLILAVVPADQRDLRADIERIGRNALYHAPESHHIDWADLGDTLAARDANPRPEWLDRAGKILAGLLEGGPK